VVFVALLDDLLLEALLLGDLDSLFWLVAGSFSAAPCAFVAPVAVERLRVAGFVASP